MACDTRRARRSVDAPELAEVVDALDEDGLSRREDLPHARRRSNTIHSVPDGVRLYNKQRLLRGEEVEVGVDAILGRSIKVGGEHYRRRPCASCIRGDSGRFSDSGARSDGHPPPDVPRLSVNRR
ncbi:MAG: hypothetical protein WC736_15435 [Gallionella sp.]